MMKKKQERNEEAKEKILELSACCFRRIVISNEEASLFCSLISPKYEMAIPRLHRVSTQQIKVIRKKGKGLLLINTPAR